MSNRKERRAKAAVVRKLKPELRAQVDPGEHPTIAAYKAAAGYQKLITEVHDGAEEALRWADPGTPDHDGMTADRDMLRRLAFEARARTIEAGMAYAELVYDAIGRQFGPWAADVIPTSLDDAIPASGDGGLFGVGEGLPA
mgnify:CR=1 FL=1